MACRTIVCNCELNPKENQKKDYSNNVPKSQITYIFLLQHLQFHLFSYRNSIFINLYSHRFCSLECFCPNYIISNIQDFIFQVLFNAD